MAQAIGPKTLANDTYETLLLAGEIQTAFEAWYELVESTAIVHMTIGAQRRVYSLALTISIIT